MVNHKEIDVSKSYKQPSYASGNLRSPIALRALNMDYEGTIGSDILCSLMEILTWGVRGETLSENEEIRPFRY